MMLKIIGGIVGGAHNFHVKLLQNCVRGQLLRKQSIGALPDSGGRGFIQKIRNAEISLQLEMGPMIERVAQRVGNGSCPSQKFFIGRSVPGDVVLRDAIGPQGAPFVMVSLQPDFPEIPKPTVSGNVLRRKMTVVVENRLRNGELMIKMARGIVREKKIFGEKASHGQERYTAADRVRSSISSQESYQFSNRLTERRCPMCSDAPCRRAQASEPTPRRSAEFCPGQLIAGQRI